MNQFLTVFLMVMVNILIGYLALKGDRHKGYKLGVGSFLALVVTVNFFLPMEYHGLARWGFFLAVFPSVLVFAHAVFLAIYRNREMSSVHVDNPSSEKDHLLSARSIIDSNRQEFFSAASLGIRYALPACLLLAAGAMGFSVLYLEPEDTFMKLAGRNPDLLLATRIGQAGAYIYVLLHLGERNFHHDITSGGAMWCAVTLILGPILSVFLCLASGNFSDPSPGVPQAPAGISAFGLYFLAGMAPRQIAGWIGEWLRRLQQGSGTQAEISHIVPLSRIAGITRNIEERLREEGIEDVHSLSMCNPIRLARNTAFSKRQIADWVDEALLIKFLPDDYEKLEKRGITGAIDLADASRQAEAQPGLLDALAEGTSCGPVILKSIMERLYWDQQVQIVWALYQQDHERSALQDIRRTDGTNAVP